MEQGKILENISKSISERLKVPIILTYVSVLIIYNWDILFYLFFENNSASSKIQNIKDNYSGVYFERILICLGIAIVLVIIFAILNTALNIILKWFYKKDKETTSEIENYEKIESLAEQLSQSIEEIKNLKSKNDSLTNINQSLNSKSLNIQIADISKKDYNDLLNYINSRGDKEKILYSLKQLLKALNKDKNIDLEDLYKLATYKHEMHKLKEILEERNLLSYKGYINDNNGRRGTELIQSRSFEDFLKLV